MGRLIRTASLAAAVVACGLRAAAQGPEAQSPDPAPATAWDPAFVAAMQVLPVQEGGRVKPFDTVAQFAMYRIHDKRRMHVPDDAKFGADAGHSLTPIQWALRVMLEPDADAYPSFTIENSDVLADIGLADAAKRKRDRYAFDELRPGLASLGDKYSTYSKIDAKKRGLVQNQVVALGAAVIDYRGLRYAFEFARRRFDVPDEPDVRAAFGGRSEVRCSDVLRAAHGLVAALRDKPVSDGVRELFHGIESSASASYYLRWVPPADAGEPTWLALPDLIDAAVEGTITEGQIGAVERVERLVDAVADPAALRDAAQALQEHCASLAAVRGEYRKVPMEVSYYRADWFYNALLAFVGAFVVIAFAWLFPRTKLLPRIGFGIVVLAEGLLVAGIVVRCILRDRPPVTGLYDTILFISAVAVLAGLIIEAINRRRIGLPVAAVIGALGMFLSFKHEMVESRDTMQPLVAVLDTNFWLSTHVTTVTMGYAAGLLAGALAYVFVLGKLFGLKRGDRGFYHSLGRMVYGSICFGVVFATVGTILGGVWANYSWGRFWGWDPKENGALMIVLWYLMILHGRISGWFRHWGICLMAVLGAAVVSFSWWGVNLLGVGLHSYGFTSGIAFALWTFYAVTGVVFALGVLARWRDLRANGAGAAAATPSATAT